MRILFFAIFLVAAPLMAAETEQKPPENNANRPKGTGPLSPLEAKFQGTWKPGYTIVIEGRDFCADTQQDEWYEGYIVIRADEEPAHFDFVIEDCACGYKGMSSKGIYHQDGETIVVAAPVPGNPRPQDFEKNNQRVLMRFKGDGRSQVPGEHCSTWVGPATAR